MFYATETSQLAFINKLVRNLLYSLGALLLYIYKNLAMVFCVCVCGGEVTGKFIDTRIFAEERLITINLLIFI